MRVRLLITACIFSIGFGILERYVSFEAVVVGGMSYLLAFMFVLFDELANSRKEEK